MSMVSSKQKKIITQYYGLNGSINVIYIYMSAFIYLVS